MINQTRLLTALGLFDTDSSKFLNNVNKYHAKPGGNWSYDPIHPFLIALMKGRSFASVQRDVESKFTYPRQSKSYVDRLRELERWIDNTSISGVYDFKVSPVKSGETIFTFPKTLTFISGGRAYFLLPHFVKNSLINVEKERLLFGLLREHVLSTVEGEFMLPIFFKFLDAELSVSQYEESEGANIDEVQSLLLSFGEVYRQATANKTVRREKPASVHDPRQLSLLS